MERFSYGTTVVLPEVARTTPPARAASETEVLVTAVERAIERGTSRGVHGLRVEILRHGIVLTGRCGTFYVKQKAQHAAMGFCGSGRQLHNRIEVV